MEPKQFVLNMSGAGTKEQLVESLTGVIKTLLFTPEESLDNSTWEDPYLITTIDFANQ